MNGTDITFESKNEPDMQSTNFLIETNTFVDDYNIQSNKHRNNT